MCLGNLCALDCRDFGTRGRTYEVIEEDLSELISQKVRSRDLSADLFLRFAREPFAVDWVKETVYPRTFFYDPKVISERDLRSQDGTIIIRAGTEINPLKNSSWDGMLLFFDGSNAEHLSWAKSQRCDAKWILVCGRPLELEAKEQRPVFFDQKGVLTRKLEIFQVPARVSRHGDILMIEEVKSCSGF